MALRLPLPDTSLPRTSLARTSPPRRTAAGRAPRGLGAVALTLALLAFGANMASPLYPGYQAEYGFSDLTLTVVYATYAVASVPALLVFGPLGDRLGWRLLLRVGLALGAGGSLCFVVADGPVWLLGGRIATGLALGAATGAGMAALVAAAPVGRRARYSTLGGVAFVAGTAAGPALTGLLAQSTGSYRFGFVLHLTALGAVWLWLRAFHEPPHGDGSGRPHVGGWWVSPEVPPRSRRVFAAAASTGAVSWTVVGLFLGLVPSVVARAAGTSDLAVLGALAGTVLGVALPAQLGASRVGARRAQRAGLALLAAALLVLALSGAASAVGVLMVAAVLAGLGHGLAYGGAHDAVQAASRHDPHRAGGLNAAAYVVFYLGAGLPTVVVGLLSVVVALGTAVSVLAWCTLLAAATAAAATTRRGADPRDLAFPRDVPAVTGPGVASPPVDPGAAVARASVGAARVEPERPPGVESGNCVPCAPARSR